EALEDYGGTLIFVSHDRYFVDKLATKVIEVGGGQTLVYPGGYEDFVYWKKQREAGVSVSLPSGGSPSARAMEQKPHAQAAALPPAPPRPPPPPEGAEAARQGGAASSLARGLRTADATRREEGEGGPHHGGRSLSRRR